MKIFSKIEENALIISLCIFFVIAVGGFVEVIPAFKQNVVPLPGMQPYTALQTAGKIIYHREGCNDCHSQLIRPFKIETERYGSYSLGGEFAYDRPFLFGSRRIGPDLMRVGSRRSTDWHELHFRNVRTTSPGSIMPNYTWFFEKTTDLATAYSDMHTQKTLFAVPYDQPNMPALGTYEDFQASALQEAQQIAVYIKSEELKESLAQGDIKEIFAIIAYLNSLK